MEYPESSVIRHEPCPKCGSSDNLARYSDGHAHCFGMGCGYRERASDEGKIVTRVNEKKNTDLIDGQFMAITARGITEETCIKMGYRVGEYKGKPCHIADYHNEHGELVAQKLRFQDKTFIFNGTPKKAQLFGARAWKNGGTRLVVTEGELDALSVCQALGNKWPVVSIPTGASGAVEAFKKNLAYIESFNEIVLCFDSDDAGQQATELCLDLITPGKAKVASIAGYKDANEALMAGEADKIVQAVWNAKAYRPDSLISIAEIVKNGIKPPVQGLPWFSDSLTKLTFGRRYGEIYTFGAGTGVGKTDWLLEQAAYDAFTLKQPIGLFFLEHDPDRDTTARLLGKIANSRFHIPQEQAGWKQEDLDKAAEQASEAKIILYKSSGMRDWESIRKHIRFLRYHENVRIIYLDNLTALASGTDDEKEQLDTIMKQLANTMQELDMICHLVSHLTSPEKVSHEEGARVMLKHFRGSRAIGFWTHFAFGLERNTQAETDEERKTTTFRVLKDRYTGQSNGKTIQFAYQEETGRLVETQQTAESYGF